MLLALTSAWKCSEIRLLNIRFYTKVERKFCFNVIKPTKIITTNKPLPVFEPERILEEYILQEKPWREN